MQSEVPEMRKALTMLRNVPLYHLPSYQIHGSWKSNRPPFSVCPRVVIAYFAENCQAKKHAKNPVCPLTNRLETGIIKIEGAYRQTVAPMFKRLKK